MQLGTSFPRFLATAILVLLSLSENSRARLTKRTGNFAPGVRIPIQEVRQLTDSNVPPQIIHQQHVNRGSKRLARMTGRAEPTDHELLLDLHQRISNLSPALRKRYNYGRVARDISRVVPVLDSYSLGRHGKVHRHFMGSRSTHAQRDNGSGYSPSDVEAEANNSRTSANKPSFTNSIGLDIEANDAGYIGTIQIGTPPRDFRVLIDSGSADFWVGSEDCRSNDGSSCGKHSFLGPNSSSSFTNTNTTWSITYGSGAVSGQMVQDSVSVAGLVLKSHTFGVVHNETNQFSADDIPFDGLMGLAQSALSRQSTDTVVDALQKSGLIKEAITSYKLSRLADGKNDGEITFGAMDPSKYNASSLVIVSNVNDQGFWEASVGTVKVNGNDLGMTNRTAILDTGTTLLAASPKDVEAIHKAIPGSKSDGSQWTIPCTTTAVFSISFGGQEFTVDPRDLAFSPIDTKNLTGDCSSGITSSNVGGDTQWLVGDVFLKNVYFSTDVGKNQISLAKLTA